MLSRPTNSFPLLRKTQNPCHCFSNSSTPLHQHRIFLPYPCLVQHFTATEIQDLCKIFEPKSLLPSSKESIMNMIPTAGQAKIYRRFALRHNLCSCLFMLPANHQVQMLLSMQVIHITTLGLPYSSNVSVLSAPVLKSHSSCRRLRQALRDAYGFY